MNPIRRFLITLEPYHYAFIAVNFAVSCGGIGAGAWLAYWAAGACS